VHHADLAGERVVDAVPHPRGHRLRQVVAAEEPDAIRRLKDEGARHLYASGSGTLVRAMLADGLVDELHLLPYPLTRGSGPRRFPEEAAPRDRVERLSSTIVEFPTPSASPRR
jgi:dihydrofolate reductase